MPHKLQGTPPVSPAVNALVTPLRVIRESSAVLSHLESVTENVQPEAGDHPLSVLHSSFRGRCGRLQCAISGPRDLLGAHGKRAQGPGCPLALS